MGRQTVLFKSEEKKNRNEAAVFLRQIADKVETGNLSLQLGNESVNLDFPQNLTLEIKAEEDTGRKTKRSLEIELEWIVGDHGREHGYWLTTLHTHTFLLPNHTLPAPSHFGRVWFFINIFYLRIQYGQLTIIRSHNLCLSWLCSALYCPARFPCTQNRHCRYMGYYRSFSFEYCRDRFEMDRVT